MVLLIFGFCVWTLILFICVNVHPRKCFMYVPYFHKPNPWFVKNMHKTLILSSISRHWSNCLMYKAPESLLYPGLCSLCRGPVKRAQLINLLFMSLIAYICTDTSSGRIFSLGTRFQNPNYRWRCLSYCLLSMLSAMIS